MSAPVVRRLQIDLSQPPLRHWNGGDALRTAFFDASSFGVLPGSRSSSTSCAVCSTRAA